MLTSTDIVQLIQTGIPDALVQARDTTGGGDHWSAVVISVSFEGKSRIEQHQAVYGALGEMMKERIHALELKTYTPDQARKAGLIKE